MNALRSRAAGYDSSPGKLPPPSFNIQDRNKLIEVGQQIKKIYIPDGSKWQNHLGLAIAVSFFIKQCKQLCLKVLKISIICTIHLCMNLLQNNA